MRQIKGVDGPRASPGIGNNDSSANEHWGNQTRFDENLAGEDRPFLDEKGTAILNEIKGKNKEERLYSAINFDGVSAKEAHISLIDSQSRYNARNFFKNFILGDFISNTFNYVIGEGRGVMSIANVGIIIASINSDAIAYASPNRAPNSLLSELLIHYGDESVTEGLNIISNSLNYRGSFIPLNSKSYYFDIQDTLYSIASGQFITPILKAIVAQFGEGLSKDQLLGIFRDFNIKTVANNDEFVIGEEGGTLDVLLNDSTSGGSNLQISSVDSTSAQGATISIVDGKISYDPQGLFDSLGEGQTITDSFKYTISDGHGNLKEVQVIVIITGRNDSPLAVSDAASTDEDNVVAVDVLANDSDPDNGDSISLSGFSTTNAYGATVSLIGGQLHYDPSVGLNHLAVGETVIDTFSYTILDTKGATATVQVQVTVTGVNDAPTANNDAVSVNEDSTVDINVRSNDTDPDTSDTLTISNFGTMSEKGATISLVNNQLRYDPQGMFNYLAVGESVNDMFSYTISDSHGGTSKAQVMITVTGVNDGPTANPDAVSVNEDSTTGINVRSNDTDPDASDTLTINNFDAASANGATVSLVSGQLRYDSQGLFNYLAAGESINDTFSYTISDGHGGTSTAQVTITVTGVNDGPTANPDAISVNEDSTIDINVRSNDTDPDTSDTLTISNFDATSAKGATISLVGGQLRYDSTTALNHLGAGESINDTFSYTISDGHGGTSIAQVTITVTGVNDGPTANPDAISVNEDSTIDINVRGNDTDPDTSDTLTISNFDATSAKGATISLVGGQLRYDPTTALNHLGAGESINDTFSYTILDGHGGTSTAQVTVKVTGVNDGPTANDEAEATNENSTLDINVLSNDTDPDTSDTLTISNFDATSAKGATISLVGGQLRYDPTTALNHLGVGKSINDTFSYTISDGHGGTSTAQVTVKVTGVNDEPTANPDAVSVNEDSTIDINVRSNDTDPDTSDILAISNFDATSAQGATITLIGGQLRYDSGGMFNSLRAGQSVNDTFSYTVSDGHGGTSTAQVTVTVTGVNDGPSAGNDNYTSIPANYTTQLSVLANDTDPDSGDTLTIDHIRDASNNVLNFNGSQQVVLPSGAIITRNGNGTLTYDPRPIGLAPGQVFNETFSYVIRDGSNATSTSVVSLQVLGYVALFTSGADAVDFNNSSLNPQLYNPTSFYSALEGDDVVILPTEANLIAWAFNKNNTFKAGAGNDIITAAGSNIGFKIDGGTGSDILTGSSGSDIINGGADEAGSADDDTIIGTAGNDSIDGGAGSNNILSYSSFGTGLTVSYLANGHQFVITKGAQQDNVDNIQELRGSSAGDTITHFTTYTGTNNFTVGSTGTAGTNNANGHGGPGGSGGTGSIGGTGSLPGGYFTFKTLDGQEGVDTIGLTVITTGGKGGTGGTGGKGGDALANVNNFNIYDGGVGGTGGIGGQGGLGDISLNGGVSLLQLKGGMGNDTVSLSLIATGGQGGNGGIGGAGGKGKDMGDQALIGGNGATGGTGGTGGKGGTANINLQNVSLDGGNDNDTVTLSAIAVGGAAGTGGTGGAGGAGGNSLFQFGVPGASGGTGASGITGRAIAVLDAVTLNGGNGDDIVTLNVQATGSSPVGQETTVILQNSSINGGTGNDSLQLNLSLSGGGVYITTNMVVDGGIGIDTFTYTNNAGVALTWDLSNPSSGQVVRAGQTNGITVLNIENFVSGNSNDTFNIGNVLGGNSYDGGNGADLINFASVSGAVTVDFIKQQFYRTSALEIVDSFSNIEQFSGTVIADVFVFGANGQHSATIFNFTTHALANADRIDISDLGVTAANFNTSVSMVDGGGATNIDIRGITFISLIGVNAANVNSSDFILAP